MENIIEKARQFKYNSLEYVDIRDIDKSKVLISTSSCIFLYQNADVQRELYWNSKSSNNIQLFWAADSKRSYLDGLKDTIEHIRKNESNTKKIYLEFVPENFLENMYKLNFSMVSEWVDFWNSDLFFQNTYIYKYKANIRPLMDNEIKIASDITKSCKGYSRGFTGQSEENIEDWFKTENSQLFAANVDGNIIGLCFVILYGFDSDKGTVLWIRELAVTPNYQSKGIGRQLIIHGIGWGKENGAKRSFLACDAENYNAINLYESLNYKRKDGRGQINMELSLF
ncbi:GNAT family N-acetyltransferase [Paratissierella segnis]|jgi:GNAT superfamily N-acetyltransferase|uniref:GNAT family N-acetyltransferase n=1 Tax=Paratissierella segnis TaxID=2763679 RepID=A0A926EUM1_9FIRM|nr:GNAT family N-acetyltransferase [Paratissierella segnis]MBC8588815.1 GNAT family N-acetyltransferase [Paratissierella segnis]